MVETRAWSYEIALRAAGALVASAGGRAMQRSHPAQRLLREAAFFSIQAQSADLRSATLDRLQGLVSKTADFGGQDAGGGGVAEEPGVVVGASAHARHVAERQVGRTATATPSTLGHRLPGRDGHRRPVAAMPERRRRVVADARWRARGSASEKRTATIGRPPSLAATSTTVATSSPPKPKRLSVPTTPGPGPTTTGGAGRAGRHLQRGRQGHRLVVAAEGLAARDRRRQPPVLPQAGDEVGQGGGQGGGVGHDVDQPSPGAGRGGSRRPRRRPGCAGRRRRRASRPGRRAGRPRRPPRPPRCRPAGWCSAASSRAPAPAPTTPPATGSSARSATRRCPAPARPPWCSPPPGRRRATGPISWVRTYAGSPSTSTFCNPAVRR